MLGTVVIFIKFPAWLWSFDLVLNPSVMSASVAMRVYIFHDHPFQTPVMSPFFQPHQPFGEVAMDDIRSYFVPLRYPTDDESDSDTHLTLTASVESDPSELSYPSYHVETDPSEPYFPSVICLSSDSASSSSAAPRRTSPPLYGCRFIHTSAVPRGCGRAQGGRRRDASPGGFGNGYLPPDE